MRYIVLLLLGLSACGDLTRSLPELAQAGPPNIAAAPDDAGGGTSGGSSTGPLPSPPLSPLLTTGLMDDFKDGNGTAEGWGAWKTYGGGSSNPSDEQHSALFTAPGFADNSAQLTYTADTGSYSYSQLAIVFDANQNLHNNIGLTFHMKGSGSGVVGLYVMTRLSTASNGFATYGIVLGAASDDWRQYDVKFSDLETSGSPPFSLANALDPNNFQGFKWNVGKPNSNTPIQGKSLQLDDVSLHP